jgi:pyruvate dehydrogenase E1 component beta subunit
LLARFGPERVRDTPISEQAIVGAVMGAAMTGLRPIGELMFSDFFAVAWDMVANQIAKTRYMTDGQVSLPLVLRTANGAGVRFGAQHSQSVESWAMGIRLRWSRHHAGGRNGLMAAAIRDRDQSCSANRASWVRRGPDGERRRSARRRWCARVGRDVSLALPWSAALGRERLAADTAYRRSDRPALLRRSTQRNPASVEKTSRLAPSRGTPACAVGRGIVASSRDGFYSLDAPIVRITSPHIPLPSAAVLEDLAIPTVDRIVSTVQRRLEEAK